MPLYFVIMLQFATSHVISSSVVFESTLSIYPYRDWADIRYFFINSEIVFPDHRTSPAVSLSIMKTSTTATVTPPFSLLRLSQMPFHNCNKLRTGNRRTLFYEIVAISLNYWANIRGDRKLKIFLREIMHLRWFGSDHRDQHTIRPFGELAAVPAAPPGLANCLFKRGRTLSLKRLRVPSTASSVTVASPATFFIAIRDTLSRCRINAISHGSLPMCIP